MEDIHALTVAFPLVRVGVVMELRSWEPLFTTTPLELVKVMNSLLLSVLPRPGARMPGLVAVPMVVAPAMTLVPLRVGTIIAPEVGTFVGKHVYS